MNAAERTASARWRRWGRRLWRWITGISIRYKLLGMVLATILLLGLAVTVQVQVELASDLRQSLEERGIAITRDLAEDATDLILTQNIFGLNQELRATLETNPDVRYVFVLNPQGQPLAHSFPNRLPPDLLTANPLPADVPWQVQILNSDEGLITDVAAPIFEGKLGVVRLGLSHRRLEATVAEATRRLMLTTLAALGLGAVAVLLLTRILTRPIFDLLTATRAVSKGDLHLRPPVRMTDEVGELTAAFNTMTEDLARFRDELLRQNRQLAALNAVARAVSGARNLSEVLDAALRSALNALGCTAGWVVLREEGTDTPVIIAAQGLSEDFLSREVAPNIEPCRCLDILHAQSDWQLPILRQECPRLRRAADHHGPEACFDRHLSIPLVSHNQPLGVLNLALHTGQPFQAEQVELAGAIGRQVGVAVDAERQRRRLVAELARREVLRGQLLERIIAAQEEERRRIARELHDEAGQALTSLMVGLRLLEREVDTPETLLHRTAELRQMTDRILENLHRLAMDLRPASLDHVGLVAALRQYVDTYSRQHHLKVQFEAVGLEGERLPPDVETALYRIVQEALTNVARHARASRVGVLLERRGDRLVAIVEDDGIGFLPETVAEKDGRLGLFGMRERAEMLGGTLSIESTPGKGTTIFVEVKHAHSHLSGR
ncbi:MAG: HAMP domain-containing protein [Chloroflexi bacterium]|nr:MAG: HAMP domain-containing protein [Chloroflexota bacterium]